MKNIILLIFILLVIKSFSFGQICKLQAGTSISKFDWSNNLSKIKVYNNNLIGYSVFLGLDYLNKKYFNLSSNIGIISKGGKMEYFDTTMKAVLNYLSLNSMLEIKIPINNKLNPFISIGPRFDYLISYSEVFKCIDDMNELGYKSYGFLFGGGLKYDLDKLQIGVRADYYYNLNKIAEWPESPTNVGGHISSNALTVCLTAGYKIK